MRRSPQDADRCIGSSRGQSRLSKQAVVGGGACAALLVPGFKVWQLHTQDGSLDGVEPRVPAEFFMQVTPRAAMIAQAAHVRGKFGIVRGDEAGISIRA